MKTGQALVLAAVTGVASGGHGTGTALDDTQLYDVSTFSESVPPHPDEQPDPEPFAVRAAAGFLSVVPRPRHPCGAGASNLSAAPASCQDRR